MGPRAEVMRPLLLLVLALPALADDAAAVRRDLARARAELARRCEADGLAEEAVREWTQARAEDPAVEGAAPALSRLGTPVVLDWPEALHAKYLAYRERRAQLHGEFARRWLALGDARAAVALAPDFAEAREKLGDVLCGGVWLPDAEAGKRAEGLLPIGGGWAPEEEVRLRRAAWADAWEVRGAHFLVRSNRSEEAAREVLALAEAVYAAVHRELAGALDPPPLEKPLAVYDFASRADYLAHLDAAHDGGGSHRGTPGFFSSRDGASHFAPLDEAGGFVDDDVRRHEIAHQVCDALYPPQGYLAEHAHFWAWEGMAGYFESLEVRDGKLLAGDPRHPRLQVARRALQDGRTLPLAEFVALAGDGIKGRYNQSSALAHFFMRAEGGRLRAAFLRYFRAVAGGTAGADAFEKAFGRKPAEFEDAWRAFALGAPAAVAAEAAIRRAAADGHAGLARAAAADGLAEEAIRAWQRVERADPGNAAAAAGIAAAGKPWVLAWDDDAHGKFTAWAERDRALRAALALRWAALAAERDAAGDRDGAWIACQEAFACDPDCREARAVLGERKVDGAWVAEEEAARRDRGLLPFRGDWLPAEEVRRRRTAWDDAWEVEGPHYRVRSNRSLAAARAVLARAEEAHAAFSREILGVVDPPPCEKKMPVLDFATLDDLHEHCRRIHGGKEAAPKNVPGFFTPGEGAAHFGPLPEGSLLTRDDVVRHECVHQASDRAFPMKGWMNARPGFWAWEGVASYFESTEARAGKILAGRPDHVRFALAIAEAGAGKLRPLGDFAATNQSTLGHDYQQAALLVHFFLHAGGARYREKFIAYFRAVSTGVCEEGTFEEVFGVKAEAFEKEFSEYAAMLK